jgi:hydroxyacylglutathione hydrolase
VGLCALASGKYPVPDSDGLPFAVWPLRMTHGIGVVNAYIVDAGNGHGLLFDTGPGPVALHATWPPGIRPWTPSSSPTSSPSTRAGFPTALGRFHVSKAFIPAGAETAEGTAMGEGEEFVSGR